MAIYEFKKEDVYRFANEYRIRTYEHGHEIQFERCPFCNGGEHRDKKTFAINTETGAYNCKRGSCGAKGNMVTLAQAFGFHLSEDVMRYYNIANYNGKFRKFKDAHRRKETTNAAIEYLKSRGISEEVAKEYAITTRKNDDNILVFPFYNESKELTFVKYRNLNFKKGESKSKEWCEAERMPILFGMDKAKFDNETMILTEGQIDSLSIITAGIENAFSVPMGKNNFAWLGHCWNFVTRFKRLIVFGDLENGEMSLLDYLRRRFQGKIAVLAVRLEDYKGCKDANEILQKFGADQIKTCIENAEAIPVNNIRLLSDVTQEDPFRKEKLALGFKTLDRQLYGGLTFGGYALITGKAGEGKSTLANQIICQALEQAFNCFIYSGELTNSFFKNGIDRQLAGKKVIKYQDGFWHDEHYAVPGDVQQKISEWYRNRCFIYTDEINIEDDVQQETLLDIMEDAIRQYNVRVLLIDNLMTALDLEAINNSDRFEKQAMFVRSIARFTRQHNVLIILVAHKRKNDSGDENDNIMGTSDIANLATVIINFSRVKGSENQNLVTVSKERVFGATTKGEGLILSYDPASKRLYEDIDELERKYSWDKDTEDGFADATTDEIPF